MLLRYFQKGFNYSQDGPGNRLVYHLSGCNLTCPWCANPEGMRADGGKAESVEAIAKAVISARPMFFDGGGLTLTGGEATVQFDAVRELLERVKDAGINTCIETNATHPRLKELFPLLNYLIADYKLPDGDKLKRFTGGDIKSIENNLLSASESGIDIFLRTPLIHSVNDSAADLDGFLRFFKSVNRPGVTVEFLRYHEYGKDKWKKLGMEYKMRDAFVTPETAKAFEDACRAAGLNVVHT